MGAYARLEPEVESFKQLLLEIAQKRSLDEVLKTIVDRLAQRPR